MGKVRKRGRMDGGDEGRGQTKAQRKNWTELLSDGGLHVDYCKSWFDGVSSIRKSHN